jgi:dTDP-4-dehydrorhamnose 3,5-epimerase
MALDVFESEIPGCKVITLQKTIDERGHFIKPFDTQALNEVGINLVPDQTFFSVSNSHVIRGLHFQMPPFDQDKIIVCLSGRALDVVVDLRRSSKMFGRTVSFELRGSEPKAVWIPKGLAHGFLSQENGTTMGYWVNSKYSIEHDTGIRWDSIDFKWPATQPIISTRDKSFVTLKEFKSPFL